MSIHNYIIMVEAAGEIVKTGSQCYINSVDPLDFYLNRHCAGF